MPLTSAVVSLNLPTIRRDFYYLMTLLLVGCDTVRSSPGSEGSKPGPAGPGLKNIETGLDWKPGRSNLDI
jgi:hypothetical protein